MSLGQSPKEAAAGEELSYLKSMRGEMSKPTFDLESVMRQVIGGLKQSGAIATSAMSQNVGEQLSSSGVAPGQPRSEAYISALAPLYSQQAATEAMTTSDLAKFAATNQLDIKKLMLGLSSAEAGAISGMKSSTALGDWMGFLTSIAKIASSAIGIPGIGGGGTKTVQMTPGSASGTVG